MQTQEILLRYVYIPLAAVAGAVTAMSTAGVSKMSKTDMALTFICGFSFAIFVTPWIAHSWLGVKDDNIRAIAGLTYIFGAGSNILLPFLIGKVRSMLGAEKDVTP